jgi:predicted Zn finger-like uncharacterized protein
MIRFACPQCQNRFQVEEDAAGKKTKCPKCGSSITVPQPDSASAQASTVRRLRVAVPLAAEPMPSASPPSRLPSIVALGIGGLLLVVTAVAVTLWASGRASKSDSAAPPVGATAALPRGATAGLPSSVPPTVPAASAGLPVPGNNTVAVSGATAALPVGAAAGLPSSVFQTVPRAAGISPAPASSTAAPPEVVALATPAVAGPAGAVDVIRLINPVRDALRGAWTFQGTALASPRGELGVLRLPVAAPKEYRLTIEAERGHPSRPMPPFYPGRMPGPPQASPLPEGADGLCVGLSIDGHPTMLVLDGWQGTASGLSLLDGRTADQNDSTYRGSIFRTFNHTTIICTVGPGSVDVTADGRTVVHWTGPSERLTADPQFGPEAASGLVLAAGSSAFRIHRIELVSLSGPLPQYEPPAAVAAAEAPAATDAPADTPAEGQLTDPTALARRSYGRHVPYHPPTHSRIYVTGPPTTPDMPPGMRPHYVPMPAPGQPRVYVIGPVPRTVTARAPDLPPMTGTPPPAATIQCVALIQHPLASGSGFAVGKKLVVTNAHVVEGAFPDEIKVQFGTENSTPQPIARILHFDRARDLCVMEVPSCTLPGLPVRGDYELRSGDAVTLMGNPAALTTSDILIRNAVNHGTMANVVQIEKQSFYQIEASVNHGWSGGPVIDADGKVIAVVTRGANDRAVIQIREAMKKLDEGFRGRVGMHSYNVGLTYGVPASAVAAVLKDPGLYDEQKQAEANDRCAAKTLTDRLSFLAELSFLRMSINVPEEVRKEARSYARGKMPASARHVAAKVSQASLLSEFEAKTLRTSMESDAIATMEEIYRKRIDERVEEIQSSPTLPDGVKRDLKLLAQRVREGLKYAEHPTGTYLAYSSKVKSFAHDFKEYLKRLEEGLKEKES